MVQRYGEMFYPFEGLRKFKDKFLPIWRLALHLAAAGGALRTGGALLDVYRAHLGGGGARCCGNSMRARAARSARRAAGIAAALWCTLVPAQTQPPPAPGPSSVSKSAMAPASEESSERADAQVSAAGAPAPDEVWSFPDASATITYIRMYRPKGAARDVVLFASGDGGWNLGVVSMARRLAAENTLVAGFDTRHYLAQLEQSSDSCVSPATDFENLSRYLQNRLELKQYLLPTVAGYSSGAALAYATLAEAPDGAFKGGLSLGFCPDLDLKKPLCKGSGVQSTPPAGPAKGELEGVDVLAGEEGSSAPMDRAARRARSGVCPAESDPQVHGTRSRAARSSCCRKSDTAIRWKRTGCRNIRPHSSRIAGTAKPSGVSVSRRRSAADRRAGQGGAA